VSDGVESFVPSKAGTGQSRTLARAYPSDFSVLLAGHQTNQDHIGLAGLQQKGVEFV
jgi:hypothetical protein